MTIQIPPSPLASRSDNIPCITRPPLTPTPSGSSGKKQYGLASPDYPYKAQLAAARERASRNASQRSIECPSSSAGLLDAPSVASPTSTPQSQRWGSFIYPSQRPETPTRPTPFDELEHPFPSEEPLALPEPGTSPLLSPQQQSILDTVLSGESVFFTGSAGTGKSVLLRAIIEALRQKHCVARRNPSQTAEVAEARAEAAFRGKVAVTASTGLAALNIGGRTLHAWAGVGRAEQPVAHYIEVIGRTRWGDDWRRVEVLIIDEISMISCQLFDMLDEIGRAIRRDDRVFGGIQLVICGDFFQLPPVIKGEQPIAIYAFESEAWQGLFGRANVFELDLVFRQRDPVFIDILNELRFGIVTSDTERRLSKLERSVVYADGIEPLALFPTNREVDLLNANRLRDLPGRVVEWEAADSPGEDDNGHPMALGKASALLDRDTRLPGKLELKIGAVVMCVVNVIDLGVANGSRGIVLDFLTPDEARAATVPKYPVVRFAPTSNAKRAPPDKVLVPLHYDILLNRHRRPLASRTQVPLVLAWSLTIHKSQGQTLDRVRVDLRRTFADGQVYVALSRATSMDTLEIQGFDQAKVSASDKVLEWCERNGMGRRRARLASH